MSIGFTTCAECGELFSNATVDSHACEPERRISYQVSRARPEIERIDIELARYLETARGKFELWYAERTRLRAA